MKIKLFGKFVGFIVRRYPLIILSKSSSSDIKYLSVPSDVVLGFKYSASNERNAFRTACV